MGLEGVRIAARRDRRQRFTALLHHITPTLLVESFHALKRSAATDVDGVTWEDYEKALPRRIHELHREIRAGTYRVRPSRRVHIPKSNGQQRPLGVASIEDKVVQQAVATVLGAIYEEDFLGFSYGFRPGRGQHEALDALAVGIERYKVNWILDADIRAFFDEIDRKRPAPPPSQFQSLEECLPLISSERAACSDRRPKPFGDVTLTPGGRAA